MVIKVLVFCCLLINACNGVLFCRTVPCVASLKLCAKELNLDPGNVTAGITAQKWEEFSCVEACIARQMNIIMKGKIQKNPLEYNARQEVIALSIEDPKTLSTLFLPCVKDANKLKDECQMMATLYKCFLERAEKKQQLRG